MKRYQTLHCHTKTSDGFLTHRQVLDICGENNIGVVAFTDHDSLPKDKVIKELIENKKHPAKWIVGIEISADKPTDFKDKFSPHIVGLFVDPFNRDLIKHCEMAQEARRERMSHMVKKLNGLGFNLIEEDCLKASKGEAVGRPHIVQAIKSKEENLKLIEKLRKKMEQDADKNEELRIKYDLMMQRGESQYPYALFLSDDSYIKGVYVDYLYRINLDDCVKLIRKAGGLAFFAHWFTEISKCDETSMEKLLREDRIDGAETVYGFYDDIKDEFMRQRAILQKIINRYHKLESGGADAHTEEQLKDFAKDSWYAGLTIDMAENILSSGKVDGKWSSL